MKMRLLRPTPTRPGVNDGWAAMSSLMAGFVVWGGLGWLLDRWLETRFLTPVGLVIGMALGVYAVVARAAAASDPATQVTQAQQIPAVPGSATPRRENECP